jgi:hypothetical protein
VSITKRYRQSVYGDYFTITYYPQRNGTYKLYCLEHPHDPFGKSATENHLFSSGQICVTAGREPTTFDQARAIAAAFIDGWSEYVRTGTFPKGSRSYNV